MVSFVKNVAVALILYAFAAGIMAMFAIDALKKQDSVLF